MKLTLLSVISLIVAAGSLIALAGCGRSGFSSARGVVTLDGRPLADAMVVFSSPDKPLATARTNAEGEFQMQTGSTNGIKPGDYAVTVTAFHKSEKTGKTVPILATPKKYSQAESSNLKVVVGEEGNDDIQLALDSL